MNATDSREAVLAQLAEFRLALDAALPGDAVQRVHYHVDRLEQALRSSHAEGIRFAAYTIAHTLATGSEQFPPAAVRAFEGLRTALEQAGHRF